MSTPEEVLAALLADEGNDDDGDDAGADGARETSAFKALRDSKNQWEKKAKDLARENKALLEFKTSAETTSRAKSLEDAFKELELTVDPSLYGGDEVSVESIKQWAVDKKIKNFDETGGTTEDKSKGFSPGGAGDGAAPNAKLYTREEWLNVVAKDAAEGKRLFEAGYVDTSDFDKMKPS